VALLLSIRFLGLLLVVVKEIDLATQRGVTGFLGGEIEATLAIALNQEEALLLEGNEIRVPKDPGMRQHVIQLISYFRIYKDGEYQHGPSRDPPKNTSLEEPLDEISRPFGDH